MLRECAMNVVVGVECSALYCCGVDCVQMGSTGRAHCTNGDNVTIAEGCCGRRATICEWIVYPEWFQCLWCCLAIPIT